jgi:hypothetical protein
MKVEVSDWLGEVPQMCIPMTEFIKFFILREVKKRTT